MFMNTHIVIAKNVYENLKTKKNIVLNKRTFIYGNIAPDFIPDFVNAHHYKEFCYDRIKHYMKEIATTKMTLSEFSYKAGIICHYISDIFCYPHNQSWRLFEEMAKEHIIYETKQQIQSKDFCYTIKDSISLKELEDEYIDFFIHNLLEEYKKIVDYNHDVKFSIIACYKYIEASLLQMFKYNLIIE